MLPIDGSYAPGQSILDFPEDTPAQIDIMFHKSHSAVFRPTFLVVVTNHIFVIWVRILSQIPLDKFSSFISSEFEYNIKMVHIPQIQSYWMFSFNLNALEYHKFIFIKSWSSNLVRSVETHDE